MTPSTTSCHRARDPPRPPPAATPRARQVGRVVERRPGSSASAAGCAAKSVAAPRVIAVGVREDKQLDATNAVTAEKWHDHATPGIGAVATGAGVHDHPAAARGPQHRGIALPHVEKM